MCERTRLTQIVLFALGPAITFSLPVAAQPVNLSFEQASSERTELPSGWSFSGNGYEAELDSVAFDGKRSLRLTRSGEGGWAGVFQSLPAAHLEAVRVRLGGWVRTRDANDGMAGLSMVVWGANEMPLYMETMAASGATGTQGWTRYEIELPIPDDAARVDFGAHFTGAGTAWFDALSLEAVSDTTVSDSVRAYFERALDLMQERSIRRDSIDWTSFRAAAWKDVRGSRNIPALHPVLEMTVPKLGDRHSNFIRPVSAARPPPAMPVGEMVRDRFGYLHVPEFGRAEPHVTAAYADSLRTVLLTLHRQSVCGWIVDLRNNTGGNMWPMIAGLGSLTGVGTLGWFVYRDGSRTPWGYEAGASIYDGQPRQAVSAQELPASDGAAPVAVLTNRRTASSGEAVAVAFRGRPNTRSFGSPTAGQSTGNETIFMSDGARLAITTSIFADRTGEVYGGAVVPDVTVDDAAASRPSPADDIAAAAIAWLEAHPACLAPRQQVQLLDVAVGDGRRPARDLR